MHCVGYKSFSVVMREDCFTSQRGTDDSPALSDSLHSGNFNRQHSEEGRVVALADEWFLENAARTIVRNLRDLALAAVEFAREKRRSDGASCRWAGIRCSGLGLVSARRGCSLFAAGGCNSF